MNDKTKNTLYEIGMNIFHFLIVFTIIIIIPYTMSGIWPPFVSIMSGSMEPNINTGDLIYTIDNERYTDDSKYAGVYTMEDKERKSFNEYGDVIVYYPDGDKTRTPVIHRAAFYVEEGDNWVGDADSDIIINSCSEVKNCPAPNKGFITIGDDNSFYDQSSDISRPVKEEWIHSRANNRVPYLGIIRNFLNQL